jgi:hypothetical protein
MRRLEEALTAVAHDGAAVNAVGVGAIAAMKPFVCVAALLVALSPSVLNAQQATSAAAYVSSIRVDPERDAYYGDLHLHTAFSLDAYIANGARILPEDAYRFARGDTIGYFGLHVHRQWPLDFMAVTDHAEHIGAMNDHDDPKSSFSRSELGRKILAGDKDALNTVWDNWFAKTIPGSESERVSAATWQKVIDAANRFYEPGRFTTFIGYEWTSDPGAANLHRNVIFRGDWAPAPFTAIDSVKPEDLWSYLEAIRRRGIEALAIPHNSNSSTISVTRLGAQRSMPTRDELLITVHF